MIWGWCSRVKKVSFLAAMSTTCGVCRLAFGDDKERVPLLLIGCGHSFCAGCVENLAVKSGEVACPLCRLLNSKSKCVRNYELQALAVAVEADLARGAGPRLDRHASGKRKREQQDKSMCPKHPGHKVVFLDKKEHCSEGDDVFACLLCAEKSLHADGGDTEYVSIKDIAYKIRSALRRVCDCDIDAKEHLDGVLTGLGHIKRGVLVTLFEEFVAGANWDDTGSLVDATRLALEKLETTTLEGMEQLKQKVDVSKKMAAAPLVKRAMVWF